MSDLVDLFKHTAACDCGRCFLLVINGERWLHIEQVQERTHLSRGAVLALIYASRLPAKRLRRGAWHVREADLARWLATPDNA